LLGGEEVAAGRELRPVRDRRVPFPKRRIVMSVTASATPSGTSDFGLGAHADGSCATSQYRLADEPAVPVNQYRLTLVSSRSRSTASSGRSADGSVHSLNFSTIHAS
jgi:hypothetical protein